MANTMSDLYGPDSYAHDYRCEHGEVIASRSPLWTWTLRSCWRCVWKKAVASTKEVVWRR